MRQVTGIVNGIIQCDLSTEICLLLSSEHTPDMNYHTMEYTLRDEPSHKQLKTMFCKLFWKPVELQINDMERVEKITILTKEQANKIKVLT
jgi:hypothetical protein